MYRHVLKRFQVPRLEFETHSEYVQRADLIACEEAKKYGIEYSLNTDEHQSFIYSETKGEYFDNTFIYDVDSIVIEIIEVPQLIKCEVLTLALFHDKVMESVKGDLKEINSDYAETLLMDTIIQLKSALRHVKKLNNIELELPF
jgi:hypothetical protein